MAIIDWVFVGLYFVLLIVIGVQTISRIETPEDFAVAGNRIIWPVFFGSLAASFLGGGSSLGNAGATYKDGYVYMFAFFAFAIQNYACWLLHCSASQEVRESADGRRHHGEPLR